MTFRLSAKNLFLTYPRCNETKEDLLNSLITKLNMQYAIIARELHSDNTPHLHAYIELSKKCNIKDQDKLDFNGHHGNYTACRNIDATKNYIKKDQDFIEYQAPNENIMDACRSLDQESFLLWCVKRKIPRGYYDEAKKLCCRTFDVLEDTEWPKGNLTLTSSSNQVR